MKRLGGGLFKLIFIKYEFTQITQEKNKNKSFLFDNKAKINETVNSY